MEKISGLQQRLNAVGTIRNFSPEEHSKHLGTGPGVGAGTGSSEKKEDGPKNKKPDLSPIKFTGDPMAFIGACKQRCVDNGGSYWGLSNSHFSSAEDIAKAHASAEAATNKLVNAAHDLHSPDHVAAKTEFTGKHGSNIENVKTAKLAKAYKEANINRKDLQDPNYENKLKSLQTLYPEHKGPISDQMMATRHHAWKSVVAAKHETFGYRGDQELLDSFDKHY